jgi:hypothetical protein
MSAPVFSESPTALQVSQPDTASRSCRTCLSCPAKAGHPGDDEYCVGWAKASAVARRAKAEACPLFRMRLPVDGGHGARAPFAHACGVDFKRRHLRTYFRDLAAGLRDVYPDRLALERSEGAGNAGCPMHPQPRVRFVVGVCTRVFTAEAPETSGIPHAMVLTAYIALSPGTGRSCPRRSRDKPATLTPASGRQDHTTSPSASGAFVSRAVSVHHSPPHVRDDRETPL